MSQGRGHLARGRGEIGGRGRDSWVFKGQGLAAQTPESLAEKGLEVQTAGCLGWRGVRAQTLGSWGEGSWGPGLLGGVTGAQRLPPFEDRGWRGLSHSGKGASACSQGLGRELRSLVQYSRRPG